MPGAGEDEITGTAGKSSNLVYAIACCGGEGRLDTDSE